MGVYGLWRLLEASGRPVPLESLEGKVLAIDISIWMYQMLQGYQDRHGAPRPNAHLLGLFIRICKLLYYKVKPVFVFDGGVPMLKKNTIASRRKQKSIAMSKAQKMKANLMNNLIKHNVVKTVLLNKDSNMDQNSKAIQITINTQPKHSEEDMFALPDMPSTSSIQTYVSDDEQDSDTIDELSPRKQSKWMGNIHNVDVTSSEFKALPADVRYDILTDLKETRKQNSWGRLYEMPEESQDFSGFQLKRLLKRRFVQESLESAEKEMGGKTLTLEELEKLLTEQGINTKANDAVFRIASDSTTRLIYISDKNALPKNPINNEAETNKSDMLRKASEDVESIAGPSNAAPLVENMNEYELIDSDDDADVQVYDNSLPLTENINEYTFDSDWESESDVSETLTPVVKKYFGKSTMNPALTYMLEYSGLSQDQIMYLIKHKKDESHKTANESVKMVEANISSEESNSMDDKALSKNSEKLSKSIESQHMQNACTINELIPSSPESDNFIEVESLKDNSETSDVTIISDIKSTNNRITEQYSCSATKHDTMQSDSPDSDSDDFIEIQDAPISHMNISRNITKKENIEITFKSDEKLENDMFADIFEKADKNEVSPTNYSKHTQSVSTNGKHQTLLISEDSNNLKHQTLLISEDSNDLKTNLSRKNAIHERLIEEKTETESLENIQLTENIPNNEGKVHDSQNSDKPIEQDNIHLDKPIEQDNIHLDSLIQADPVNECMQKSPVVLPTNEEGLIELKGQLEDEQEELTRGIGKLERQATNISDQIRTEAQELLRLFGIPYIVAPMEAEAQCAYLEQIKLTDGTITDDSDIWLFGGQCVYKNFFNNNKRVLQFRDCDIQHHFKLNRNQLIQLALLVGSDYTTGVSGIGTVTALEILASFPSDENNVLHGLYNFCSWIKEGRVAAPGKAGLRNKLRNVKLDRDFPNQAVVQAYLFPTVDESKETFTWGKPNVVLLCDYTRQKFGWTKDKFDDTMIPVLRRMEENKNQKLLDMYFKTKISPRSIESSLSKRVQKAVRKLDSGYVNEENVDSESQSKKSKNSNIVQKSSRKENAIEPKVSTQENEPAIEINATLEKSVKPVIQTKHIQEYIPQREQDKACALEKKLHAIEVFRKSKKGLGKTRKIKNIVRKIKQKAELSESDSN